MVLVNFLLLVPVVHCPENTSEDFLIEPRLAAPRHIAQQANQRAARSPPAPENPEGKMSVQTRVCPLACSEVF